MANARYIIRMEDQALFPWFQEWLKIPGMVEYDPDVHGYRSEVAAQMGLPTPVLPKAAPALVAETQSTAVDVAEHTAGEAIPAPAAAVAKKKPQTKATEPDLSAVFEAK